MHQKANNKVEIEIYYFGNAVQINDGMGTR